MKAHMVEVRGYWCPICGFAFHVHTDDELSACAEEADARRAGVSPHRGQTTTHFEKA